MEHSIVEICRQNPQIIVFLALGIGYALAKIKFFGISLGATTCVLLTALVLGQIGIDVPDILKTISFALFTFCIGYKVGPQFFGALKKEGLKYVALSLVVAFTALGGTIGLAKFLHFDPGTTAGFFAGSVTQSAAIGTAEGAIKQLSITDAEKQTMDTNLAIAYAITYIFGTVGGILFFKVAPRILRIDFKEEARKLQESMSGGEANTSKPELFSWTKQVELRAYRVTNEKAVGKTVSQVESLFLGRVAISKIKRKGDILDTKFDTKVEKEDIVVIAGGPKRIFEAAEIIGKEVDVTTITNILGEIIEVCVLSSQYVGKTLGEISKGKLAHGIFLTRITRQGSALPITRDTVVNKCDVIQIIGAKDDVDNAATVLGYPERNAEVTDLIMVGIGCVIGTLFGLIVEPIMGVPITLGVGGGVLVSGLIFGWLRSLHPTFGEMPTASQWLLQNIGLNLFVACVGISAGPKAVQAFQTTGVSVLFAGMILCLLPFVVGLFFGKVVLKMNPVLLLGALAGSRVLTAALNTLQEDAGNATPVLGYAAPYAFGNVLLTIWGSLIVTIM